MSTGELPWVVSGMKTWTFIFCKVYQVNSLTTLVRNVCYEPTQNMREGKFLAYPLEKGYKE